MLKLNLKSSLLLTALAASATGVAHSSEAEKDSLASSTGINRLQDVGATVSPSKDLSVLDDKSISLPKLKESEFFIAGALAWEGNIINRNNPLHMALTGNNFFVVNTDASNTILGDYAFTRTGTFYKDQDNNVVNHLGQYLKYFPYDLTTGTFPVGCNTANIEDTEILNLLGFSGMPQATSSITIANSLPGNAAVADTRTQSIVVYDNLGGSHTLDLSWEKRAVLRPGQIWNLSISASNGNVQEIYNQGVSIEFDGRGLPMMFALESVMPAVKISWNNGASDSLINLDLGTAGTSNGITAGGGENFYLNSHSVNGYPAGRLIGVEVAKNGEVSITFDNGAVAQKIGRIPVATFSNTNALLAEEADTFSLQAEEGITIPLSKISDYSLKFLGDDK